MYELRIIVASDFYVNVFVLDRIFRLLLVRGFLVVGVFGGRLVVDCFFQINAAVWELPAEISEILEHEFSK